MGSGETRYSRDRSLLCLLAVAVLSLAAGPAPRLNHSFDIQAAGRTVCADGAVYVGETTAASAVGILQTSEVWDATGTSLLATGDSHTFAAVGETYTYTVMGTLTVGSTVTLSVTDVPGTLAGNEGDAATETVGDCSIVAAPSLPTWAMALLALALVAAGGALLGRGGRHGSPVATA